MAELICLIPFAILIFAPVVWGMYLDRLHKIKAKGYIARAYEIGIGPEMDPQR